ncbi:MAG: glutamate racemase [Patescibacteria group bacterium]|nr:glutamate racemase [Patescibacteria group bacterium]
MIGIFDSGLGGLTVIHEFFKQLPQAGIVYFGDTARTPYGNKGPEIIEGYAHEDTRFLINQGADIIVIACNTASAVAFPGLKKKYPSLPIFEVISPAVKAAVKKTKNKRIGVIGTRATINSGIYKKLIKSKDNEIKVFSQPAPLLVPLVEENWLKRPETKKILKKYLWPLKQKQVDTLILGCTHYPFLKNIIKQKTGKNVALIDSASEIVKEIKKYLEANPEIFKKIKSQKHQFFVSDLTPQAQGLVSKWFDNKVKLEYYNLS